MFNLKNIFNLSKTFALPDNFLKSKNYCIANGTMAIFSLSFNFLHKLPYCEGYENSNAASKRFWSRCVVWPALCKYCYKTKDTTKRQHQHSPRPPIIWLLLAIDDYLVVLDMKPYRRIMLITVFPPLNSFPSKNLVY